MSNEFTTRDGFVVTIERAEIQAYESETIDCYWKPEDVLPVIGADAKYWNVLGEPRYGRIVEVTETIMPTSIFGGTFLAEPRN